MEWWRLLERSEAGGGALAAQLWSAVSLLVILTVSVMHLWRVWDVRLCNTFPVCTLPRDPPRSAYVPGLSTERAGRRGCGGNHSAHGGGGEAGQAAKGAGQGAVARVQSCTPHLVRARGWGGGRGARCE